MPEIVPLTSVNIIDVRKEQDMDNNAIEIERNYIVEDLDKSDKTPEFEVFVVWRMQGASELEVSTVLHAV